MMDSRFAEIDRILRGGDVKCRLARDELPTPALLLDLDAFEFNVRKMADHCSAHQLAFRPHAKTHKCPEVARRLIAAGAVGACTAKLSEAELFAGHNIGGLLITTPVVGAYKLARAVQLAMRRPDTMLLIDHPRHAEDLDDVARAAGVIVRVVIDLHVGKKGGIPPGEPALSLAKLVDSLPNLSLAGLQAYAGFASHVEGFHQRREASEEALAPAFETRRRLERSGIPCDLLTGGSTGTYNIDSQSGGLTELQPGSFIFMDLDYNRIGGEDGGTFGDFRNALSVLTTVVSKPSKSLAIVDGGYKAFATDRPYLPEAIGRPGIRYAWGGDEHGKLDLTPAEEGVELGDRIAFAVPHCDPTVNLYDRIYCLRGEAVEAVWEISARGMSQ